ncbi:MAG: hybrid sensor histidine kinase/response regulator [Gammaproteobacteria bacterium]
MTVFNEKFVTMWRLPRTITDSREHRHLLEVTCGYFKDPTRFVARVDDICAASPPESYDLLELADGRVFERFSRIQFVDERNVGRVWSFRDITERKRAEAAERESQRQLQFIMDSMPQKIFTAKPNGDVDYFNPQWTEFTGLSFEQIKDWGWTQFLHPDDVAENVRIWQHSIDTGERFQFEHRFRRADGEYHWHLSRAVALKDAGGKVLMWIGSNTDIHEQRQTANELRKLAAELSQADRRKNEFLAMLAHELRNPLAPIRNSLQVLRLTDGSGEAVRSASAMMERQVGQMVRLVDELLDVSRISRGKIELCRGRIELASAVHHAIEAARPHYESMDHELTVTLPPEPVHLNADPIRLAQVMGNLLTNAGKFTEKGGRIWLTVERESGEAVIRVRDSGIGIAAEELPRIFDMFTQVDTSLERSRSGLGIGLTLVKNLVELHGGTVAVHSAGVGQGSEFTVRLPILVETLKPPPPEPTARASTPTTARRILVVDDNRDSAESLAVLLKLTGHETHTAYDGLEAVEAAAVFRPNVLLLDIGLPKLNGFETARKIREQPWGNGMVLVALTGWGQEEDRRRSEEAGFNAHLVKPVDIAALTKLLAELQAAKD